LKSLWRPILRRPAPRNLARLPGASGRLEPQHHTHDIGAGAQTVFCQIAASELGIPIEKVSIAWGDTSLPRTWPVYGSSSTMSTGSSAALAPAP
jgi:xanthine dehydrogenase YagR molybdenum-binding subunit